MKQILYSFVSVANLIEIYCNASMIVKGVTIMNLAVVISIIACNTMWTHNDVSTIPFCRQQLGTYSWNKQQTMEQELS